MKRLQRRWHAALARIEEGSERRGRMQRHHGVHGAAIGLAAAGVVAAAVIAVAEDVQVTTYYPSPRGVYEELRTTRNSYFAYDTTGPGGYELAIGTNVTVAPPAAVVNRRLHIYGTGNGGISQSLETTGTGDANIHLRRGANDYYLTLDAAGLNIIDNKGEGGGAATTALTVADTGRIGIGTTAPGALVHLYSTANANIEQLVETTQARDVDLHLRRQASDFYLTVNADGLNIIDNKGEAAATTAVTVVPSGRVGIGTTNPDRPLKVAAVTGAGNSEAVGQHTAAFEGRNGYGVAIGGIDANLYGGIEAYGAGVPGRNLVINSGGGNVAIGTTTVPAQRFSVTGGNIAVIRNAGDVAPAMLRLDQNAAVTAGNYRVEARNNGEFVINDNDANADRLRITTAGNLVAATVAGTQVIIGQAAPLGTHKLVVRTGPGAGTIYAEGGFRCQANPDVSEKFAEAHLLDRPLEVGDVVAVDPQKDESVTLTRTPYDPTVAGVVSENPGVLLAEAIEGKPIVLVGRVPTRVTTEGGPIRRGDILVTASKLGYAMRADPDRVKPGMVVGKALGQLEEGEGTIVVLVNLQ